MLSLNVICIHLIFDLYDHVDFALKYFSSGLDIFTSYFFFPSISVRYLTSYFIIIIKNINNLIFKQDLTSAFFCCLPLQTPNLSKNQKFYFQIVINFILQWAPKVRRLYRIIIVLEVLEKISISLYKLIL